MCRKKLALILPLFVTGLAVANTGVEMNQSLLLVAENQAEQSVAQKQKTEILPKMVVTETLTHPYQVENSTAGTRFPVELERVPQSIQVINADLIEDKGVLDLTRLLRNVASASVGASRNFTNGVFGNSLNIRGFPLGVTRNGFRHLYFEDVDPSAFSNIESVEILKGPGSAVFGQEGLGGTLNYVTKKPLDEFHAKFRATYGEHDLASGTWDITGPIIKGHINGRFTGEIERSDTFVDFQEIDRNNLAASLAYDPGTNFRAYLNTEFHERDSLVHPGLPIFGTVVSNGVGSVAREAFLGEVQDEYLDYDGTIVQAWAEYDINENWMIKPRFQYFQWNGLQNMRRLRGPVEGELLNIVKRTGRFDFNEHDFEYSGQIELIGQLNTGPIKHQTVTGIEYSLYDNIGWWFNYDDVPDVDSLNPDNTPRQASISDRRLLFQNNIKTFAVYFQDLISVTERFDILGSIRYEDISVRTNFCFGPCANDQNQQFENVTFQIGGSYKIVEPVSLFVGYGTGIDVDNILGSFTQDGSTFDPEESEQVEVGFKIDSELGIQGTVAYFHNTRKNLATTDPSNPDFSIQAGEHEAEGAEIELSWRLNDNLFFQFGYAYIDGRISKSNNFQVGNRLTDVAEHQANIWARYLITEGWFENLAFASGFNYVGERAGNLNGFTIGQNGEQVAFELPEYVTIDLSASYQFDNIKLELIAQNILDEQYFTAGNDFVVHPGDARQIFGRVGVEF